MIRRIVSIALHQPLFIVMLLVLFVAAGIAAFRSLPVEAFPDVTDIQVTVITLFPGPRGGGSREAGHDPARDRAERAAERGADVLAHAVRALVHHLTFNDDANDYFARQQVLERLQAVDLPDGRPAASWRRSPRRSAKSTATASQGKGLTPTELRSIQDWVVERQSED